MILPKERLFGNAKGKTAARSETHARTQLADINKATKFYYHEDTLISHARKFINFYYKKKTFIFALAK
jgi:hypothetical protein